MSVIYFSLHYSVFSTTYTNFIITFLKVKNKQHVCVYSGGTYIQKPFILFIMWYIAFLKIIFIDFLEGEGRKGRETNIDVRMEH